MNSRPSVNPELHVHLPFLRKHVSCIDTCTNMIVLSCRYQAIVNPRPPDIGVWLTTKIGSLLYTFVTQKSTISVEVLILHGKHVNDANLFLDNDNTLAYPSNRSTMLSIIHHIQYIDISCFNPSSPVSHEASLATPSGHSAMIPKPKSNSRTRNITDKAEPQRLCFETKYQPWLHPEPKIMSNSSP